MTSGRADSTLTEPLAPLSDEALDEIDRALRLLGAAADAPLLRWALCASWALCDARTIHCLVSPTHFVAVGGRGWALLGYELDALLDTPWAAYLMDESDVAASHMVVALNAKTETGVDEFYNTYRHGKTGAPVRVRWKISPWREGLAVARGVLVDGAI